MSVIKNLNYIRYDVPGIEKLEAGAALHKRHSNIEFKILSITEYDIVLNVSQGKTISRNYADIKTLILRTKELFQPFFPGKTIHVHAIEFQEAPIEIVDSKWITDKMLHTGTRIKDIQSKTGIDKTNLSAWINGLRPMSQPVKAMFYLYFNQLEMQLKQQLRLGNLVITRYGTATIIENKKGQYIASVEKGFHLLDTFDPILLTIEWLKKFGFDQLVNDENFGKDELVFVKFLGTTQIYLIENKEHGALKVKMSNYPVGSHSEDVYIKYVHQLQNVYFELTSEELTFKTNQ